MKKFFLILITFVSFPLLSQELMNMVPDGTDYAIEIDIEKTLKIKKVAELLPTNQVYLYLNSLFQSKGLNFEKSVKKALIAGNYGKNTSVIFDTRLTEQDFVKLISEKKAEIFNISSRKVYKYIENKKAVFVSYLKKGKIIFSENPTIVTDLKTIDLERILKSSYPLGSQFLARGYFSQIEKILKPKHKEGQNKGGSLFGNGIKEGYFEINSADDIIIDNIIYIPVNQENQKLVDFQINTLFILLTAKIASGNQKLADELRRGFRISNQGNLCKVSFKIDSSLLNRELNNFRTDNNSLFDPFAE